MQHRPAQAPTRIAVLALLALLPLAGCLSAGADEDPHAAPAAAPPEAGAGAGSTTPPDGAAEAPDLGHLPHVHDYWNGRERVTLVDDSFEVTANDAAFWTLASTFFVHEPMVGGFFLDLPDGALVYEGTGLMEITATWEAPTIRGLKFAHRHAGSTEVVWWKPAPNGETVGLDVAPDMTDMAHAAESRWLFIFSADGVPPLMVGSVHLRIDIVKMRDVALLPGHPDHFGARVALPILDTQGTAVAERGPRSQLARTMNPLDPPRGLVRGDKPVPMETGTLNVTVTVEAVEPADLRVHRLDLFVVTASGLDFEPRRVRVDPETTDDRRTWKWRVPVEMEQTDGPYAEKSAWAYRVTATYEAPLPGLPPCGDGCHDAETRYRIEVVAEKRPPETAA